MAYGETRDKGKATPPADPNREAVGVIVRFIEAFNNRDAEVLTELLSEEHLDHTYFGKRPVKPEAVGRAVMGMWDTFPDWHETIDEIIPSGDGTMIIRHTGRGTQAKPYMGREPDGKQIAAPLITVVRVENGKITEYRSTFPFTRPWDETITSGKDIQEVRAEQGGFDVDEEAWSQTLQAAAAGDLDVGELTARRQELADAPARCQSLLAENMRRCQNNALPGSLYCSIHQEPGAMGGFGA